MEHIEYYLALITMIWAVVERIRAFYISVRLARTEDAVRDLGAVGDSLVAVIEKTAIRHPDNPIIREIKAGAYEVNKNLGTEMDVLAPRVAALSKQVGDIMTWETPVRVDRRIAEAIENRRALTKELK